MAQFARANSPYYRELYENLPEHIENATQLPVTSKARLMARFDDWVTDREVKAELVRKFVENPDLIGERFLGKYTAAITSGTSGFPGMVLLDRHNQAANAAWSAQALRRWLSTLDFMKIFAAGRRVAVVAATGSHFAVATTTTALRKTRPGRRTRLFSAQTALPDLVDQLNSFRPAILIGYASLLSLLATEQEAGRLRINPVLVLPMAEALTGGAGERIARIFAAKVRARYAATECFFMASGCEQGWLHLDSDWVLLEPVDSDYRPVPPGQQSHTVLVSNLANRVQPILRYDLGDSVMQCAEICPCGNPLPAIQVQGRVIDFLKFSAENGDTVTVAPLVLETVIFPIAEITQYQIVQSDPTTLRLRLRYKEGADLDRVWNASQTALARVLGEHGLGNVAVQRAEETPIQLPNGKLRTVIPLR